MFDPTRWVGVLLAPLVLLTGACASSSATTEQVASRETGGDEAPTVSGREARALVQDGAVLLDVRSPTEYAIRHLDGAKNIPIGQLEERVDELAPDEPVVVYCMSGHRSAKAGRILQSEGYTDVYDLGSIFSY